jgi:hypothetical protein
MTAKTQALYRIIASKVDARYNCLNRTYINQECADRHEEDVERLVSEHLPSGSGFDAGTKIDWNRSNGEKLVFTTSYHHMNEHGVYDGWTEHDVTIAPSLIHGFTTKISGKKRSDIKDYIADLFNEALNRQVTL